jgi:transcriptional regulator with PAS, ATPase and Fis domain
LQLLLRYHWPGNVRELENVVEQAVILSPGDYLIPEMLPHNIKETVISTPALPADLTLDEALAQAEKHLLLEVLERYKWNRQLSARALGISRTTLFNKMRRFQLLDPRRGSPGLPTFPDLPSHSYQIQ